MSASKKMIHFLYTACLIGVCFFSSLLKAQSYQGPIIDMHLHGFPGLVNSGYYKANLKNKDQKYYEFTLKEFDKYKIVYGLVGVGNKYLFDVWNQGDKRIALGPMFPCFKSKDPIMYPCDEFPDIQWLEKRIKSGEIKHFGELLYVYYGMKPTDPRLKPYWQLADKYKLPVGVHGDLGPPKRKRKKGCCEDFNGSYAHARWLRPILKQYPNLKLYIMHYGRRSLADGYIKLMKEFPNVYCEVSAVSLYLPRRQWEPQMQRLFYEGLGDRLMFASDYGGRIGKAIEKITEADWMSSKDMENVFYFNAARFLEVSQEDQKGHWQSVGITHKSN